MRFQNPFSARTLCDDRREPYFQVFVLGFFVVLLTMIPVMVITGGYFIYYGDFNSQQIPFYQIAHDAVQHNAMGWNWNTDLGANFIGSYAFYLLGSPFFWLSLLFPSASVPYLLPWLLALKHGVAALTSYAFIRRFVRSRQASMVGALLYAYSGFQVYNIFFNHFQDVTAFFPLLLIALEELVNHDRRGVFALCVGFMAMLNYYFFTGQVVFVILYFILRCPCKDFDITLRKFFDIAIEAVLGVLLSCVILLPAALAVILNNRVGTYLTGLDMVAYGDRTRLWHILQSFFMLPDVPARPNLFQTDYGKWSSIGGYLPLFSMTGVLAFLSQKRKHWASRLTIVCIVCACIPVLNSMFYTFNSSYYARWYYMPILIMAMMTAYALDSAKIRFKSGFVVCGILLVLFAMIACFPTKDSDGNLVWMQFAKYPWYFWLTWILCVAMLYVSVCIAVQRHRGKPFLHYTVWATAAAALVCTCTTVYFGISRGMYPQYYVSYAIHGGEEITLEPEENQFFRVDICEDYDNYPMLWGYSCMRCFHSIVPTSIMDFYDAIGVTRDVASRADTKQYPLRAMFNVKYYFDKAYTDQQDTYDYTIDLPGFTYRNKQNGFYVYENEAYLPMGVAYDFYIDNAELDENTNLNKQKIMLQALGMDAAQIVKYADILEELPTGARYGMDEEDYVAYCQTKAVNDCCDSFVYDSYGFQATITLDSPKLVFFSVPAEDGWTAEVNGKPVDVELVNYGFMAVRCEAGENEIHFSYETPGLRIGICLTAMGGLLLLLYLVISRKFRQCERHVAHRCCYDYAGFEPMPMHTLYLRYAARKYDHAPVSTSQPEGDDSNHAT